MNILFDDENMVWPTLKKFLISSTSEVRYINLSRNEII